VRACVPPFPLFPRAIVGADDDDDGDDQEGDDESQGNDDREERQHSHLEEGENPVSRGPLPLSFLVPFHRFFRLASIPAMKKWWADIISTESSPFRALPTRSPEGKEALIAGKECIPSKSKGEEKHPIHFCGKERLFWTEGKTDSWGDSSCLDVSRQDNDDDNPRFGERARPLSLSETTQMPTPPARGRARQGAAAAPPPPRRARTRREKPARRWRRRQGSSSSSSSVADGTLRCGALGQGENLPARCAPKGVDVICEKSLLWRESPSPKRGLQRFEEPLLGQVRGGIFCPLYLAGNKWPRRRIRSGGEGLPR